LLIVMPKMRSADGKITVPPYDGRCASDLGDKMFINSLDLGLVAGGDILEILIFCFRCTMRS